jgi:hypothetical protein
MDHLIPGATLERPDERELALSAAARHLAFRRKIEDKASELQASKLVAALAARGEPVNWLDLSREPVAEPKLPPEIAPPPRGKRWFRIVGMTSSDCPSIAEIKITAALYYKVRPFDLECARRTKDIIIPRQVAMYLAKTLTLRSLPEIGRRFGGRDHTTVLHAVRKIARLLPLNPELAFDVATIERDLLGSL